MLLTTKYGNIEIVSPTSLMIRELQKRLPFGLGVLKEDFHGAKYGFVVQCGSNELHCLKQQPMETTKDNANNLKYVHHLLILKTYICMIEKHAKGIYYATPYYKEKASGYVESGIAHFIFPTEINTSDCELNAFDQWLGVGCTSLFLSFCEEYKKNFTEDFVIKYIGIDQRCRSDLGSLSSGFMLYDQELIFHGDKILGNDSRFELLAINGINKVYHLPSLPMAITEQQLKDTKPL